ncbi:MAG: metallophosphoesterase [Bacteroidota bacterium]
MLRIAQITDLHLGKADENYLNLDLRARFLRTLNAAVAAKPDLLFLSGDYSLHEPDEETVKWLFAQLNQRDIPYRVLAGNHDDRSMLRSIFRLPGSPDDTIDYNMSFGERDIIVLDTSSGELQPSQLAWLQGQLARGMNPMLFMHHPPFPLGVPFMDNKYPLQHPEPLLDILFTYNQQIPVFCGHYHVDINVKFNNLIVYVAPPTSFFISRTAQEFEQVKSAPGFQLIYVDAQEVQVESRYC